ncbi:MAG: hypothetical protein HKN47_06430 [Pirellulaceae bacterium]|nr:hypothetical protein [Pirellulaceae bacterium]
MFIGGLLLSATLLGFAAWLHVNDQQGWPYESQRDLSDQDYLQHRKRSRRRVHFLFACCGVLILIATIAGPGLIFVAAWTCVAFVLMTIVGFAGLDAMRTHRYHSKKLPQIRRQILDGDD